MVEKQSSEKMVMSKVKYEELRKQRVEENKRRLEELHLPLLSQALKNASPKPSPVSIILALPFYLFYFVPME